MNRWIRLHGVFSSSEAAKSESAAAAGAIGARIRAADFVSRRKHSSEHHRTAIPQLRTTKYPSSSCRSTPWRGRMLARRTPNVITPCCSDIRDSFCTPRRAYPYCANNKAPARPTRATTDAMNRRSPPSLGRNVRVS